MATRNSDSHAPTGHAPATSYRDLERTLTPLPDSSHRPTEAEAAAAEVPRPVETSGDAATAGAARAAIEALPAIDATDLAIDAVDATTIRVEGSVARTTDRDRIVAALHRLPGVTQVTDHLRVRLG